MLKFIMDIFHFSATVMGVGIYLYLAFNAVVRIFRSIQENWSDDTRKKHKTSAFNIDELYLSRLDLIKLFLGKTLNGVGLQVRVK